MVRRLFHPDYTLAVIQGDSRDGRRPVFPFQLFRFLQDTRTPSDCLDTGAQDLLVFCLMLRLVVGRNLDQIQVS